MLIMEPSLKDSVITYTTVNFSGINLELGGIFLYAPLCLDFQTPPSPPHKYHEPVTPQSRRNLIAGPMPRVDRQQHIFQAGNICQLLGAWLCSLSLRKRGSKNYIKYSNSETGRARGREEEYRTVCVAPRVWR